MQGGGQTATVIQVSKGHTGGHTIIQQNGQHVIVGKIASGGNGNSNVDSNIVSLQGANSANGTGLQTLYPTHYIEAASEQTVYTSPGNGQIQYQEYTPILYAPVSASQTYYQNANGQVITSSFGSASSGGGVFHSASASTGHTHQLVTHQGATYLVQSGQLEDETSLTHTAKASPLTVQWLVDNYETAEGVSLPRSTLYFHYLQHCHEHKLEPMNPASFGKLIRSVFLGLKTRRLGTRGNSKYHYYGIRIKPTSHLIHYVEDASFALRHYPSYHRQSMESIPEWKGLTSNVSGSGNVGGGSADRLKTALRTGLGPGSPMGSISSGSSNYHVHHSSNSVVGGIGHLVSSGITGSSSSSNMGDAATSNSALVGVSGLSNLGGAGGVSSKSGMYPHQHTKFLGQTSLALPNLDEICRSSNLPIPGQFENPSGVCSGKPTSAKDVFESDPAFARDTVTFTRLYAQSAGNMLDAVVNLDFSAIERVWKAFWRTDEVKDPELQESLPQDRLYTLTSHEYVRQFIRIYDHTFYQSLAEVLIPNVLRPIPPTLTQAIRNFAKSLENWMRLAMRGLDPLLIRIKVNAVCALAQTLRRYTSLNHLAQAARAVLKNTSQITQMLADLNRVDFNNVQEQASWVCQCNDATISQLEQDFKRILQRQASLEEWANWLDRVVTGILQPLEGSTLAYTRAAHQLVLKWSFYSSMVIRDLTLRSAASFGSFHLIRLLYDEYIFYLVEHKVAAHLGMTPVAVMGEMGRALMRPSTSRSHSESPLPAKRRHAPNFKSAAGNLVTSSGQEMGSNARVRSPRESVDPKQGSRESKGVVVSFRILSDREASVGNGSESCTRGLAESPHLSMPEDPGGVLKMDGRTRHGIEALDENEENEEDGEEEEIEEGQARDEVRHGSGLGSSLVQPHIRRIAGKQGRKRRISATESEANRSSHPGSVKRAFRATCGEQMVGSDDIGAEADVEQLDEDDEDEGCDEDDDYHDGQVTVAEIDTTGISPYSSQHLIRGMAKAAIAVAEGNKKAKGMANGENLVRTQTVVSTSGCRHEDLEQEDEVEEEEEGEEVDEECDDDEADESLSDETRMLRRAHATALARRAAADAAAAAEAAAVAATGDVMPLAVRATASSSVANPLQTEAGQTNEPACRQLHSSPTSVSSETGEIGSGNEVKSTVVAATGVNSDGYENSDSPPSIITCPPTRKVVRVTAFDEGRRSRTISYATDNLNVTTTVTSTTVEATGSPR